MPENTVLEDVIQGAWKDSMIESGTPETDLQRDEHGRFTPRGEDDFTTDEPAATGAGDPPAGGTPTKETKETAVDGARVELPVADPATLMTSFTLKDEKGELAIPQGLLIEYTANGKQRTDPLDKVVKLAQMGHYQQEREQRTQQIQAHSDEVRSYAAIVEQKLATREAQMTQLLADPAFRERAIQEYDAQQTPERQLARQQQEIATMQLEQERQQIGQANNTYLHQNLLPALDMVAQHCPNVSDQEIGQRANAFVNRLRDPRTGLVHPQQQQQINQYLLQDLIPWAQSLDDFRATQNGTRSGKQSQVASAEHEAKLKADVEAANLRAARSRRTATANLRPAGQQGTPRGTPAKAPTTRDEIMEDVIASTKRVTFGG